MIKKQAGFTLVELMVTMVIFVLVIAAASSMFTGILNQFKQQSKIAETNIEGIVGLQMFKTDIEQAGYGLPYDLDGVTYTESAAAPASAYNDATANPPRAFVASDNTNLTVNTSGSDVLVIKSTSVATNAAANKWAYISNIGANNIMRSWTGATGAAVADENLAANDRVIVLRPAVGSLRQVLVHDGGTFFTPFNSNLASFDDNFEPPANSFDTYIVYGINGTSNPVRPFNRADYYISNSNVPSRCAPNTGVLVKSVINHDADGTRGGGLPLLDCVADVQLVFALDINNDGVPDQWSPTPSPTPPATAELVRTQVKEVRVYILAHEGQRDTSYNYVPPVYTPAMPDTIKLTDPNAGNLKEFNLNTVIGSTYVNYRWKIYTMVIKPFNLR